MESNPQLTATEMLQAQCHIYKHMFIFVESMSLKCAVQLGIPDIVHKHNNTISLHDLASELHVDSAKVPSLQHLMRILVNCGFFTSTKLDENGTVEGYALTNSSLLLLKDSPTSLAPAILGTLHPDVFSPWLSLGNWFTGNEQTPFETCHGMGYFDYAKQNNEFFNSMNELMASDSQVGSLVIRDNQEIFEGVGSLVDVGGGTGTLARTIVEANAQMKCTVLDLPQVVANIPETENFKFVGGDMFQFVPSADAVIIKSVLHNWSDQNCVKILKKCREAITGKGKEGKLILVEMVIDDTKNHDDKQKTKLFVDMDMLLVLSGKERTEIEWAKLFTESGFSHYKITPTAGLNSIIEVYP